MFKRVIEVGQDYYIAIRGSNVLGHGDDTDVDFDHFEIPPDSVWLYEKFYIQSFGGYFGTYRNI